MKPRLLSCEKTGLENALWALARGDDAHHDDAEMCVYTLARLMGNDWRGDTPHYPASYRMRDAMRGAIARLRKRVTAGSAT